MNGKQTTAIAVALALLFALFINGCGPEDSRNVEAVIRERVTQRTQALTSKLLTSCNDDILEIATRRADSLLMDRIARMKRVDGRPPKPSRPGAPPVKELSAPLPLRPLFPFEIRFDTLLRDSLYLDSIFQDSLQQLLIDDVLFDELEPDN